MDICSRNGSSSVNCEILRVLESWAFWCELFMHLCMVALWLFNKDEVCWHILLTSITYLPLQRRCVECSSFIIFPQNPQLFLSYIWLMFSTCCFLVIRVFSHTRIICHWATLWLLTDLLFSPFWGAYITSFWWVLLFQNSAVVPKVAQCVVPMQIQYISYISSTISGLDHCTRSPQDKPQSQFLHTSSKRKEPKHKQKTGSLLYTEHNQ